MHPVKKTVLAGALVASTLAGGAVGAALISGSANAADTPSTSAPAANGNGSGSSSSSSSAPPAFDPTKGGHQANGITEELLTGDTAAKAKAAALAAVPGGTVQRVETDAEGAKYEAHVTKSDGTQVTVKMDADFKVTGVETGPSGQPGQAPPSGAPGRPNGQSNSSGSTSTSDPNA